MICLFIALLFTRCYEEPNYEALITCYYSSNGIEKDSIFEGCTINIGRDGYADFAVREGISNSAGQYKANFRYEAILGVRGSFETIELIPVISPEGDTLDYDEFPLIYFGKGELKLIQDETATLDLLLIKEDYVKK